MGWRETVNKKASFEFLSADDVSLLIENKGFEIGTGVYSRYLNSDCRNVIKENEKTLYVLLNSKTDSLKSYVRVTISDNFGTLEFESDFGSYEGDEVHPFYSQEDVDSFLEDLFAEYE